MSINNNKIQYYKVLAECLTKGQSAVLVTVIQTIGSSPREAGAKMIIEQQGLTFGTIGGGNLEYQCIEFAQQRLMARQSWQRKVSKFNLLANLGQCCGGSVLVLFEYIDIEADVWLKQFIKGLDSPMLCLTPLDEERPKIRLSINSLSDYSLSYKLSSSCLKQAKSLLNPGATESCIYCDDAETVLELIKPTGLCVVIFGAGHVAQTVVKVLSVLDCEVIWIDSREQVFPKELPPMVKRVVSSEPERLVRSFSQGAFYLVMTHNHALDLRLCEHILSLPNCRYCGLIGSKTKCAKFEHRLRALGLSEKEIKRLFCPVGLEGILGKEAGIIAVSVVGEILMKSAGFME